MKNFKRVLSLGLSSIMLTGMMAAGASASAADFTDRESIDHKEAVDVMVALNIINGKDDGSYFAPKDNVTRAEMAKMIAVAMKGGNAVSTGVKGVPSFSDIKGHWAESYIEYCYDLGIIAGRGDGTFDPEANVTGVEATKMVLSALGYDADAYKLTGASWAARTDELARKASPSLYDELASSVVLSQPASRDDAAQIIWNGLQNNTKTYVPTTNTSNGEVEWSYVDADKMLKVRYDADIFIGKMTGNYDMDNSTMNEGEIEVYGKIENTNNPERTVHFPSDLPISNIGEEVKVVYKDGNKGTKYQPDNKDTIYGVFNTGSTQVYWATTGDIKDGSDSPKDADRVKIGSSEYTISDDVKGTFVTFDYRTDNTRNATGAANAKTVLEGLKEKQSSDKVKLVCDDNGKVDSVYVETQNIGYVTALNGDKITINGQGTFNISDNDVYEGVEKYDVVNYTKFYNTDKDKAFYTVKKAEKVEGQLTSYKNDGKWSSLSIDGTSYKVSKKPTALPTVTIDTTTTESGVDDNDIGETFSVYLLNGMVGYVVQDSDSAAKLAVVMDSDLKVDKTLSYQLSSNKARLLLADGTKITVTLHEDSILYRESDANNSGYEKVDKKVTLKGTELNKGDMVRYSINSNGQYKLIEIYPAKVDDYQLVTATTDDVDEEADRIKVYDKDTKSVINLNDRKNDVTSGDCILFTGNGDDGWKVYNIRSLNNVFAPLDASKFSYIMKDGKAIAAYLQTGVRPSGSASSTVYGVVTSFVGTKVVKGDSYDEYRVENDQGSYTVLMDLNSKVLGRDDGQLISFEPSSDDTYGDADINVFTGTKYDATHGLATWVKEYDAKAQTLTVYQNITHDGNNFNGADATTYAIDDKVVINYIDADNGSAGSDVGISEFDTSTGYTNVLLVKDNSDDKVVAILVESSGEANILDVGDATLGNGQATTLAIATGTGESVDLKAVVSDASLFNDSDDEVSVQFYNAADLTDANTKKVSAPDNFNASVKVDGKGNATVTLAEAKGKDVAAGTYYLTVEIEGYTIVNTDGDPVVFTLTVAE